MAAEGVKVLKAVGSLEGIQFEFQDYDYGGDRYLAKGEILPKGALDELAKFDSILLGAVGHPDVAPGILERGLLLAMRFHFDQYINLRPVKLFPGVETPLAGRTPEDIDYVVVRENTEDLYAGVGGFLKKGTPDEVAMQTAVYNPQGLRALHPLGLRLHPQAQQAQAAHPGCQDERADLPATTSGGAPSRRSPRNIPTSRPTTTTSTPAACGWSRIPSFMT